jgi:hypothetical protein
MLGHSTSSCERQCVFVSIIGINLGDKASQWGDVSRTHAHATMHTTCMIRRQLDRNNFCAQAEDVCVVAACGSTPHHLLHTHSTLHPHSHAHMWARTCAHGVCCPSTHQHFRARDAAHFSALHDSSTPAHPHTSNTHSPTRSHIALALVNPLSWTMARYKQVLAPVCHRSKQA